MCHTTCSHRVAVAAAKRERRPAPVRGEVVEVMDQEDDVNTRP
jgi:hypothetical protein